MYQWQTVDKHRHIIAVVVLCSLLLAYLVLVDDLKAVVMDDLFVDQRNVFRSTVVPPEHLHKVLLNFPGFLYNVLVGVGDSIGEEPLPFAVRKLVVV